MKFQKRASLPWRTLVSKMNKSLASAALTLGLATVGTSYLPAYSSEASTAAKEAQALADGVYLYGQSSEPNQLGSEYLVFEVTNGQVVGGFYMPSSSFDCFYGNVEGEELALTVIDSYEQTPHDYAVALQSEGSVASAGNETIAPIGLEGYHRIEALSDIDHQVLNTCKADRS